MKKFKKLFVSLALLVILFVPSVFFYIDAIAKAAILSGSEYALGVTTSLGSADVGLLRGEFSIEDFSVANPQGFDSAHFLKLDKGSTKVTLSSLKEDVVELPNLTLSGIDMNLEKKGEKSNYDVIFENLSRLKSQDNPQEDEGKKFIIHEVLLKNIVVHVEISLLLAGNTKLDLPIDELKLENVGSDSNGGVLLSELTSLLMTKILLEIVKRGGGLIPADILDDLGQGLSQLDSIAEAGIDAGIKAVEGVGDILKDVGKGIDSLLGGDK